MGDEEQQPAQDADVQEASSPLKQEEAVTQEEPRADAEPTGQELDTVEEQQTGPAEDSSAEAPEPKEGPGPVKAPEPEVEPSYFAELYYQFFGSSWDMWIGAVLLSIMSIGLFLIAYPWGSSGGLLNWGHNLFKGVGMDFPESASHGVTSVLDHRFGLLSLMMLMGALTSALMANEFAIRVAPKGELAKGFIGGILMGVGAIIGMGCTVGGFYTGWPALNAGSLIFALGLVGGVFVAVRYILWELEEHPTWSSGRSHTFCTPRSEGTSYHPLVGLLVLVIGLLIINGFDTNIPTEKKLLGFGIIGLMIGIILQRSRFCIVRALREPFISGDSEPAQALMAGLLVGLFGFVTIKYFGLGPETTGVVANFWVPALLGGLIFGFGMTIAGGCTVGATWRAGEGHVKLWLALVGLIIALPLTAEYIQPSLLDALPASTQAKEFLPDTFGYVGSILVMLLVMFGWYLFVKWNERTEKFTAF